MLHLLLLLNALSFSFATEPVQNASVLENQNNGVAAYVSLRNSLVVSNRTFIDKSDNILRVPKTFHEENKRKKIKKSPKRTVQKIIKKNNKIKRKQIYVQLATRLPTVSTIYQNVDSNIHSGQNENRYTTEANQRRRPKKNSKVLRYHMPFKKLQPRNVRRNKRDTERNDVYILKDLDEIEFIGTDKDYDVVNAHVQNYW